MAKQVQAVSFLSCAVGQHANRRNCGDAQPWYNLVWAFAFMDCGVHGGELSMSIQFLCSVHAVYAMHACAGCNKSSSLELLRVPAAAHAAPLSVFGSHNNFSDSADARWTSAPSSAVSLGFSLVLP